MEDDTKKATLIVQDKKVTVTFEGLWTKSLIDSVHRAMLRDLPRHISEWKVKLSGREPQPSEEELE